MLSCYPVILLLMYVLLYDYLMPLENLYSLFIKKSQSLSVVKAYLHKQFSFYIW